jgi:diacylglycerol kinase (ATP)
MNNATEKFSIEKRVKSVGHAWRGLGFFLKTTHNSWVHFFIFVVVVCAGFYFQITQTEWLFIILVSGMVFVAESFNTAIEIDIDLTSPDFHPNARDTKDVSAGAVLISAITAVAVGIVIFCPYICAIFW